MLANDHTRLINKFIGLCKKDPEWPSTLRDMGYRAKLVEYTIRSRESGTVRPDIIAVSERLLHAIVADCKSGRRIDPDQDRRYSALRPEDLTPHVAIHDPKRLTHDACYVDNQSNHAFLERDTQLPFITFQEASVVKHGKFTLPELDRELSSSVPLDAACEPFSYYAFSPDDSVAVIVPRIMRAAFSCLNRNPESLKLTDPEFIDRIMLVLYPANLLGSAHARDLRKKIRETMSMLIDTNSKLKDHVLKLEAKYSTSTAQAMARTCMDIAKQYDTQTRITDEL